MSMSALARTIVGHVPGRRNDPVPTEMDKVHSQWVPTTRCSSVSLVVAHVVYESF